MIIIKLKWSLLLVAAIIFYTPLAAYAAEPEGRQAYFAQLGDTVEAIAAYYDLDSELVAAMNNLQPKGRLREGQCIWLPLEPLQELEGGPVEMVLARNQPASRGNNLNWPVEGIISSAFGWRSRGWHCGLDIAADYGTIVRAAQSGLVKQAGWRSPAYGNAVMLDHGNGLETLYAHHAKVLVKEGQYVGQGQAIALVGATGNATGPHVHLEVRLNDVCQNPSEYLR